MKNELFNHLLEQHDLTLLESELKDIEHIVMKSNIKTIVRDVHGIIWDEGNEILPVVIGDNINVGQEEHNVIMKVWDLDKGVLTITIRKL